MKRWRAFALQCCGRPAAGLRGAGAWSRNDGGASAVEFALVSPLLIGLLLGVIEYGSLAMVQMRMNDTARDTARRLAVHDLGSEVEGETVCIGAACGLGRRLPCTGHFAQIPRTRHRGIDQSLHAGCRDHESREFWHGWRHGRRSSHGDGMRALGIAVGMRCVPSFVRDESGQRSSARRPVHARDFRRRRALSSISAIRKRSARR